MRTLRQLVGVVRVLRKARRHRLGLLRVMGRRPQLLAAEGMFEIGVVLSARVDPALKMLAELRAASLVACEYCLDIGAALARSAGVTDEQLRDLHRAADSHAFTDTERLVIAFAEALTRSPAEVPDELRARLEATFTAAQRVELASVIAWENFRARRNIALTLPVSGFSDGEFCPVPQP